MQIRNLEPAARQVGKPCPTGFVLYKDNTEGVFMNDIVKVCGIHGNLFDDPEILENAAKYLRENEIE